MLKFKSPPEIVGQGSFKEVWLNGKCVGWVEDKYVKGDYVICFKDNFTGERVPRNFKNLKDLQNHVQKLLKDKTVVANHRYNVDARNLFYLSPLSQKGYQIK